MHREVQNKSDPCSIWSKFNKNCCNLVYMSLQYNLSDVFIILSSYGTFTRARAVCYVIHVDYCHLLLKKTEDTFSGQKTML